MVETRDSEFDKWQKEFIALDPDYKLSWLIMQTGHMLWWARRKELARFHSHPTQIAILFAAQALGNRTTPAEISRFLLREPHTISITLSKMERDGLITKVKDLDRKNLIRIALTDKGREAYKKSAERESIHRIMSYLSDEERRQLRSCLRKLLGEALRELRYDREGPFPLFDE